MDIQGTIIREANNRIEKKMKAEEMQLVICLALEKAFGDRNTVSQDGFMSLDEMKDCLMEVAEQQGEQESAEIGRTVVYDVNFAIGDIVNKGINKWLKRVGKKLAHKQSGGKSLYGGYAGLVEDYLRSKEGNVMLPIERMAYDFIKGALDFETMARIRNLIKSAGSKGHGKAPQAAFICFEDPQYEYDERTEYNRNLKRERQNFLLFADAIINRKVKEVTYQIIHREGPVVLVFHPHYIRRVNRKYMVYGLGCRKDSGKQPIILNIILSRVVDMADTDQIYRSAEDMGIDYNNDYFRNTMTYNAQRESIDRENPVRVVLKIRREKITPISGNVRRPFEQIQAEPLHHTQKVLQEGLTDKNWGYVEIYVSDYMYIKQILMAWGGDVVVEQPVELRELMELEVRRMMHAYGLVTDTQPQTAHNPMTQTEKMKR